MFKFEAINSAVSRSVGRATLNVQKYSPEILTTVGIAGVVTAGVMASRATLKLSPILEQKNTHLEAIKELRNDPAHTEDYPEAVANQDTAKVYIRTGLDIVKLYGPALTLGALSIVSIVSAHGIMRKRNVALVAAYKTLETAFTEYRERVAEEIGEEEELDIYRGREHHEIKDEETGEKKKVTTEDLGFSPYAKVFDETSPNWQRNADYNLMFLRSQQTMFNERLHARGHVFLNEVYDALGIPETAAGQLVGWIRGNGDDFVDFGIYDVNDPTKGAFVNGYEKSIWLDFNVDGVVYDKI